MFRGMGRVQERLLERGFCVVLESWVCFGRWGQSRENSGLPGNMSVDGASVVGRMGLGGMAEAGRSMVVCIVEGLEYLQKISVTSCQHWRLEAVLLTLRSNTVTVSLWSREQLHRSVCEASPLPGSPQWSTDTCCPYEVVQLPWDPLASSLPATVPGNSQLPVKPREILFLCIPFHDTYLQNKVLQLHE